MYYLDTLRMDSGMNGINIDWNAIRPLNGYKASGFEELCAQLARQEIPHNAIFERTGAPDAGVESYAIFTDGSEWGWQAKYFNNLGDPQWAQIDNSVKTALEKHPQLTKYYVCIPLDRPDARIGGRKSARERWNDHEKKWISWASEREMKVDFIYWGSHELLDLLTKPINHGRLRFWFDIHWLSRDWFIARLTEALRTAGPRYSPEINVDLPIANEFEIFGRTQYFFDQIKALAKDIRKKSHFFEYRVPKEMGSKVIPLILKISSLVEEIHTGICAISVQPIGKLPLHRLAEKISTVVAFDDEIGQLLLEAERKYKESLPETEKEHSSSIHQNPYRELEFNFASLFNVLRDIYELLTHASTIAESSLLILKGNAGAGKTHLLCDIAHRRINADQPTVILMGQRLISEQDPWTQILQQLDLPGVTAEEFVGALESAAQFANCRALLIIDAINEGSGRLIWPNHLAAFLAYFERSPWISVILSVRSSYDEIIIPEAVRKSAYSLIHNGFADHEYDATRTFFNYYGIEFPSTPLLTPEFRNPLFLKTICRGINLTGDRRIPRGFQGITSIFNIYLNAINNYLAEVLSFNPKHQLVIRALDAIAEKLVESGRRWLPLSRAEDIVNSYLPGRDFDHSLYRGLVLEGILVEDTLQERIKENSEIVLIAYDRFADHVIAKIHLEKHLDPENPSSVFADEGPLSFLTAKNQYIPPGLLEAFCIQVPERIGKELVLIAPGIRKQWGIGDAFRQSIIWRTVTAFHSTTPEAINKLIRNEHDFNDTVDVFLTVASIPDHPLNANFLDQRLRKDTMAERDAWWSISLHHLWGNRTALDRIVDWASCINPTTSIDERVVDLCAIALTWMLTTSNRFLRDRATKSLISLLSGRLDTVEHLLERFIDVNDPYVAERIYAVAYGVAMRSNEPIELGKLATLVYTQVFESGHPTAHVLHRDYARGVIERAIYIGAKLDIAIERIRPPYSSKWPIIPSSEDIKPLLPDWSRGSHDSGDIEWARNRIGSSVLGDDFARYIIGTNSHMSNWLAVKLDEPLWKPPRTPEELLRELVAEFSKEEKMAWETFKSSDKAYTHDLDIFIGERVDKNPTVEDELVEAGDSVYYKIIMQLTGRTKQKFDAVEKERQAAFEALNGILTEEHLKRLDEIYSAMSTVTEVDRPSRFDLEQIQRYILWRVFDLGWTTKRFGIFDRFEIGYNGRSASKAERIGKKYQWIAYHEIMALVSDHFQYREKYGNDGSDQLYVGPWQEYFRDIDPSCTLRSIKGGTSWEGHSGGWWDPANYKKWVTPATTTEWIKSSDEIPRIDIFLTVTNPKDGSQWINLQCFFNWKQPIPPDKESSDVEKRELWFISHGYLIHAQDTSKYLKWAEGQDFWGRWMPDPPESYRLFLGENGWSPASHYFQQQYSHDYGGVWIQPEHGCPVTIQLTSGKYLWESSSFDCSLDETIRLHLPSPQLISGLEVRWTGNGADYIDKEGKLAIFDPTVYEKGPDALLIRKDILMNYLSREKLAVCWVIFGAKEVMGAGFDPSEHLSLRISGAYVLDENGLTGFQKIISNEQDNDEVETT
jgi:hypothetical protein